MARIEIVFPVLPPAHDAIGVHTDRLASALSVDHDVVILSASAGGPRNDAVRTREVGSLRESSFGALYAHVERSRPDWLVFQYNPFSYGNRGINRELSVTLKKISALRGVRILTVIHERYSEMDSVKLAMMSIMQRPQFRGICAASHAVVCCTEGWLPDLKRRFTKKDIRHIGVGSNIRRIELSKDEARSSLGTGSDRLVVIIFGRHHNSRLDDWVMGAASEIGRAAPDTMVVYIGPDTGRYASSLKNVEFRETGYLDERDVSTWLSGADLMLAPFRRGVSSRRGSFIAGLQHGLPVITTTGSDTGSLLSACAGEAFIASDDRNRERFVELAVSVARDGDLRSKVALEARKRFEANFTWDGIAAQFSDILAE